MKTSTSLALVCVLGLTFGCSSNTPNTVPTKTAAATTPKNVYSPPKSEPITNTADTSTADEGTTRPEKVTGAYMTATILPSTNPASVQVGIVGMLDDVRISDDPENYKSTWTLEFATQLPVIVNISKSQNKDFDQTLEFFGSKAQFDQFAADIRVSLAFQQNLNGDIVSSVVANDVAEIIDNTTSTTTSNLSVDEVE